ncbi:MAG TPA: glucose 1-dehydrogenase [Patescibacteria group bacterium]|nr:glucose 1-dehydrogenase [Gammaproteobacteria bacterium]HWA51498.1 glucose 1-dehydrogenase [Patescibacteria group bacterium]
MQEFVNKVALITGATSGIGEATAIAFAKAGSHVVIAGRRKEEGMAVVEAIRKFGGDAIFLQTDVRKEDDIIAMINKTLSRFGRLDYAFNNAGVVTNDSIINETEESYYRVMDTNTKGTFFCMKYELVYMIKNKGGVIINSSSVAPFLPVPKHSLYNASKIAILSLSEAAASEAACHGVRVNVVCPIGIAGKMVEDFLEKNQMQVEQIIPPIGRMGMPEDVANVVLFLCSDTASYITGAAIHMDGGMRIKAASIRD